VGEEVQVSLSERLRETRSNEKRGLPCPIAVILQQLNEDDRGSLEAQLSIERDDAARITTIELTRILNEEGFRIHYKGVERHRNQLCRCFMNGDA
jgi:hypothetical protein